jgi:hypothetical protein
MEDNNSMWDLASQAGDDNNGNFDTEHSEPDWPDNQSEISALSNTVSQSGKAGFDYEVTSCFNV